MTTYVYENKEVQKTGRVASKKLPSGKIDKLYEITPVEEAAGTWKKWVRDVELFAVADADDEENDGYVEVA